MDDFRALGGLNPSFNPKVDSFPSLCYYKAKNNKVRTSVPGIYASFFG